MAKPIFEVQYRRMPSLRLLAALGVTALVPGGAAWAQRPVPADLVLEHGHVITVDSGDRIAQAIAVRGAKIIAVGSDAEVALYVGPRTRRIDLAGRTVTPGLIDAHAHFAAGGAGRVFNANVGYPAAKTMADVAAIVAGRVAKLRPGIWVDGLGWDEGKLAERRFITAKDIDAVSPKNPVWLEHTTGHYGVANSAALALAGITKATKDPANGTIDRYPDGTPTGVLKESAKDLVTSRIPKWTQRDFEEGIADLAQGFVAEGMTALKEPGINDTIWRAYRATAKAGKLPVRAFILWRSGKTTDSARALIKLRAAMTRPYVNTGDDHVIAGGVKVFMDGSGGARTAWMTSDWNKNTTDVDVGNRGYPAADPDTLRKLIRMYHDAGFHVSTHAIGDRAIDWVIDTYATAMRENPKSGLRHGIIHANIPSDHALDEMARLEREYDAAYPEPSASFTWWLGDTYAANFGARSLRLNPFASYLRRGIRWANGSDFEVTPFPARYGIWSAVARQTLLAKDGADPFGRAEAVDVHVALRAVTIWAAHQLFLEKKIGSVEVGKYADLAVWDRDPYGVPTEALKDMQCEMTLFNGRVVYTRRLPGR
jgi:predicted amidohydrolase YtcJ